MKVPHEKPKNLHSLQKASLSASLKSLVKSEISEILANCSRWSAEDLWQTRTIEADARTLAKMAKKRG